MILIFFQPQKRENDKISQLLYLKSHEIPASIVKLDLKNYLLTIAICNYFLGFKILYISRVRRSY